MNTSRNFILSRNNSERHLGMFRMSVNIDETVILVRAQEAIPALDPSIMF